MRVFYWLSAFILVFAIRTSAAANSEADWLIRAVAAAENGATLSVPAGQYDIRDLKIRRDLTLTGDGNVTFFSSRPVAKGLLNPVKGVSLRVENITFIGAASPDNNGAGIRHDGKDLSVVNCEFVENENGILATGEASGVISIRNSRFLRNGYGDGYSHGVYVSSGGALTIEASEFVGTKIGHHVKSLAATTTLVGSSFDDADGRTSYTLDASKGGDVQVLNNRITQAASSDNPAIINYDLTRGGAATRLVIEGNTIINRHRRGRLLRNDTPVAPLIADNDIRDENGGRLEYGAPAAPRSTAIDRLKKLVTAGDDTTKAQRTFTDDLKPLQPEPGVQVSPKRSAILKAPAIAKNADALFVVRIENNTREDHAEDYITFAHPFPPGRYFSGQAIVSFEGPQSAAQVDVKARHTDGSIRHAIFTVQTPPVKAGEALDAAFIDTVGDSQSSSSLDTLEILTARYDAPVSISFATNAATAPVQYNARRLVDGLAQGFEQETWLDGPLVKEFHLKYAAAPNLELRTSVRVYRDGDIRTSFAFANDKSFAAGDRDLVYSVAIGDENALALSADVTHHRSSVWRKTFWTGEAPRLHVAFDFNALADAGAVLPLDLSLGVRGDVVADNLAALKDNAPLAASLIQKYFPRSGGRPDIGVYPQWTANYLITQHEAAKAVMIGTAEAAGAIPWHFRDDKTGAPIRIDQHLKFWADERGTTGQYGADRPHPDIFKASAGDWTIDHAHKPSLTYIPYLVTGDAYFGDLLAMQAAYAIFGRWPELREGGLKAMDNGQLRSSAWSLRDLSNAAYILPDNDPLKAYFQKALSENLTAIQEKYVAKRTRKDAGELEGYFDELIEREPERISPWQNDFMTLALYAAQRQHEGETAEAANALLDWTSNFQAGRFLTDAYDLKRAPAYALAAKIAQTQKARATWKDVAAASFGDTPPPKQMDGYPNYAAGYIGSAYGALAALASGTKSLNAYEAFAKLARENERHGMWRENEDGGAYENNSFVLRLETRNGAPLTRKTLFTSSGGAPQFRTGRDGSDTITGDASDDLLFGFGGDDILDGLDGDDDLFGGDNDDVISGGEGNDRLVGGDGADTLNGGGGNDLFAFRENETGRDVIEDFSADDDAIAIITTESDPPMLSDIMLQTDDGVLLQFSKNSSVLLRGIASSQLRNDHVVVAR